MSIDHRRVVASLWVRRYNEEDRKTIRLNIALDRAKRKHPEAWVIK